MNKTNTTLISVALLSLAVNSASARDTDRDGDKVYRCHEGRDCTLAPEIDPGQALGALTLLGGTVAIIRGYRRKK